VRQLDPGVTAERPLHIFFYRVVDALRLGFETHWDVIQVLPQWGLRANLDRTRRCADIREAIRFHADLQEAREALPYEVDGAVFKVNGLAEHETLGTRTRDPRWALAFKFEPRRATTTLKDVVVQVGRTGKLTPVAHLKPVQIGGVEITRASLHNPSEIERRDIRMGDTVLVERAGDVIPHIVKPLKTERDGSEREFEMPAACPACGTDIVMSDDRKQARCPNIRSVSLRPWDPAGGRAHCASVGGPVSDSRRADGRLTGGVGSDRRDRPAGGPQHRDFLWREGQPPRDRRAAVQGLGDREPRF
jgi:DNA ligase (NAD+)